MSPSSGRYGGGTAEDGRPYVTLPVFTAVRGRNQTQFYLENALKKESNLKLDRERMCCCLAGMKEWRKASGFK